MGSFPSFIKQVQSIWLVEASPALKEMQQHTLCPDGNINGNQGVSFAGVPVHWVQAQDQIPNGDPSFLITNEFFDALPTHTFKFQEGKWAEVMVDVAGASDKDQDFRFVLAPRRTAATAFFEKQVAMHIPKDGEVLEFSFDVSREMESIARRIRANQGSALIFDYGEDCPVGGSLRGIRQHAKYSPLRDPGLADLSVDVNFNQLRTIAEKEGLRCAGPINQGTFLTEMGISSRLERLLHSVGDSHETRQQLSSECERLIHPDQMGTKYKVLCASFANETAQPVPVAFESTATTESLDRRV